MNRHFRKEPILTNEYEEALPEGSETAAEGATTNLPEDGNLDERPVARQPDKELTYRERYEELRGVMERQVNELEDLRKRAEELEQSIAEEEKPDVEKADSLAETVQSWADEYYREYLALGFSEEEARERARRKAYTEHGRVTELAERIAAEKYGNLAPLVEMAAGPRVLKEAVEQVYAAIPTDSISPDEVLEEMIRQYPISEFAKIPVEHQPMLVALARDLMIGRRYREGQLSPVRPHPAPAPNTGPSGAMQRRGGISPAHAQRISQWRRVMGKTGDGVSDEQVLARIREYEREGRQ